MLNILNDLKYKPILMHPDQCICTIVLKMICYLRYHRISIVRQAIALGMLVAHYIPIVE